MNENERKLLIAVGLWSLKGEGGLAFNRQELVKKVQAEAVTSERAEPIHRGMTIASRHDSVDEFVKANTVTEPEVPDEDRCTMRNHSNVRCCNKRETHFNGVISPYCQWNEPCDFGDAPDVPSEGEEEQCPACGKHKHGTNAELRSQVDELREEIKDNADHTRGLRANLKEARDSYELLHRNYNDLRSRHDKVEAKLRDQLSAVLDDNLRLRETLKKVNELAVFANNIVEKAGDA